MTLLVPSLHLPESDLALKFYFRLRSSLKSTIKSKISPISMALQPNYLLDLANQFRFINRNRLANIHTKRKDALDG